MQRLFPSAFAGSLVAPIAILCVIVLPYGWFAKPPIAFAQQASPLAQAAELVIRKGYKDTSIGQLCARFHLNGRVSDDECKGFSIEADDGDLKGMNYPKGWNPSLFTFVEQDTREDRIILAAQTATKGYAFLTNKDEKLVKVAIGRKESGLWQWSAIAINDELRSRFSIEVSIWAAQRKGLEALPDRKD